MRKLILFIALLSVIGARAQSIVNKNKIVMQVANGDTIVQRIYPDSNLLKSTQKMCIQADTITLKGYVKGVSTSVDTVNKIATKYDISSKAPLNNPSFTGQVNVTGDFVVVGDMIAMKGGMPIGSYTASKTLTTITATVGTFSTADVGRLFYWNDGTYDYITAYISSSQVTVDNSGTQISQSGFTYSAILYADQTINKLQSLGKDILTTASSTITTINDTLTSHNTRINARMLKSDSTSKYTSYYQGSLKALKSTTLTINGTTYDLSANRTWTVSAGGSFSKVLYVSDSLNSVNHGSDTYTGTMAQPYATLNKAQSVATSGTQIVVMAGNYYPTANCFKNGVSWYGELGAKIYTTSLVGGYIFDCSTATLPTIIDGMFEFILTGNNTAFFTTTSQNDVFNFYKLTNSGAYHSIRSGSGKFTSISYINTNSGSGNNYQMTYGGTHFITCYYMYNSGTGYMVSLSNTSGAYVTINGYMEKTTSQAAIYCNSGGAVTYNIELNANVFASTVFHGTADGFFNVNSTYCVGNITLGGYGVINSYTSGTLTFSGRNCILGDYSSLILYPTTTSSNIVINGVYAGQGLDAASLGTVFINGGWQYTGFTATTYGNVQINSPMSCSNLLIKGGKTILNDKITASGSADAVTMYSGTTLETTSKAVISGGTTWGIIGNNGNFTIISGGGRILNTNQSINTNGFTCTYYGNSWLRCKSATTGTITDAYTVNNCPITVDSNVTQ